MNLNVAICDANKLELQRISSYLEKYMFAHNHNITYSLYQSSAELLNEYKNPGSFHVLFLEAEIPEINGLELADKIRSIPDRQLKIIFISNSPEYMHKSFDVQAFHYLYKPVSYEYFCNIFNSVIDDLRLNNSFHFIISIGEYEEVISYSDTLFLQSIKGDSRHINIVTVEKTHVIRGTLSEYGHILPGNIFLSPCRGYIVNTKQIQYIKSNAIILNNGTHIPLSRRREANFHKMLTHQHYNIKKAVH